jgi:FdhD protein
MFSPTEVIMEVLRVAGTDARPHEDVLAAEEPLEIRLAFRGAAGPVERALSITMRTPGADLELVAGFLLTEGLVASREDIARLGHCGPPVRADGTSNTVLAELAEGRAPELARLERHFYTSSSCGVCGKTSLEAVRTARNHPLPEAGPVLSPSAVHGLPAALRACQSVFDRTGGLHAAALFDAAGAILSVREDVGRHNAVDKLLGAAFMAGQVPLGAHGVFVSGRASFELVQKALMAGLAVLAAVGAPSSLAVDLARAEGMTVVGFVREGRFNVYSGGERLGLAQSFAAATETSAASR